VGAGQGAALGRRRAALIPALTWARARPHPAVADRAIGRPAAVTQAGARRDQCIVSTRRMTSRQNSPTPAGSSVNCEGLMQKVVNPAAACAGIASRA